MKTKLVMVGFILMLALLTIGITSAGTADTSIDAKTSQVYWYPATLGYIEFPDNPLIVKYNSEMIINFLSGAGMNFDTPYSLPTKIAGQNTTVRYLYIRWFAPPELDIYNVRANSGENEFASVGGHHPGYAGGAITTTIDLNSSYTIPYGLSVKWSIHNTDDGAAHALIAYAYGAKIKYKT